MVSTLETIREVWKLDEGETYLPQITRLDLALMFNKLDYQNGAEIGVARGDFAYSLCKHNPQATVYCIDSWKVYTGYNDVTNHAQMKANQRYAEQRLTFPNARIVYQTSMEAVKDFADGALDFIYIDANHELPYVTQDLYYWTPKVRSGGIVAGHDWLDTPEERCHVKQAVMAMAEILEVAVFIIGEPSQAQSWFWIQP